MRQLQEGTLQLLGSVEHRSVGLLSSESIHSTGCLELISRLVKAHLLAAQLHTVQIVQLYEVAYAIAEVSSSHRLSRASFQQSVPSSVHTWLHDALCPE